MSVIDSLRRPEHTGENHCLPHAAVSVALVAVAGLAVSVLSPVADLIVLIDGALSMCLRGYVVPDAPSFVLQLISAVGLIGVFDHGDGAPNRRSESLGANIDPDVILSTLLSAGVLIGEEDGLFLAADVHEEWESTMATLQKATDKELVGIIASAVPFKTTVDAGFEGISLDDPSMSVWISRPQAITDVAALYTVVERGVDPVVALTATEPTQMFVEVCPDCSGPIEETMTCNCCGDAAGLYNSPEHEVLGCADCGMVVYKFPDE